MSLTIRQNKTPRGLSTFHVQDSVHPITAPSQPQRLLCPTAGRKHRAPTCPCLWVSAGKTPSLHICKGCPSPPAHLPPYPHPLLHDPRNQSEHHNFLLIILEMVSPILTLDELSGRPQ